MKITLEAFVNSLPNIRPNVRMLSDMNDVIYDREWFSRTDNCELYYMYRNLSLSKNDATIIKERGLRYDITVIPPRMLGCEFAKTAGHYHPLVPGTDITFPEIYEVLSGEAHYIMQRPYDDGIDTVMINANVGDKVIIPPGYGHFTINASDKVLKMANWVANDFESIYSPIRDKGGGAYFLIKSGEEMKMVKNLRYHNINDLRIGDPVDLREVGLTRHKGMYWLARDIEKLEFLTKPSEYGWLFKKVMEGLMSTTAP